MLYTLNLHSTVCQLLLNKIERKNNLEINRGQNNVSFFPYMWSHFFHMANSIKDLE